MPDTPDIPPAAIAIRCVRAPGPGGQNVNKVASAVQLRVFVDRLAGLDVRARARLRALAGRRLTRDGNILIQAHEHRSQEANRREALRRLVALIEEARQRPRRRVRTRPSIAQRARRIESKKRRSAIKRTRGAPLED